MDINSDNLSPINQKSGANNLKVFISHSSSDKPFVEKLARDLLNLEIGVWLDKWEIKVGDSLINKISAGLSESNYLIIVLSKNSVLSEWVNRELNYSLLEEINNQQIKVLPIIIDNCDIPIFLKDKFYADFRNDYQSGFISLSDAISQTSNKSTFTVKEVDFLTSEIENSLCMEIVISNDSNKEIWLKELCLHSLTKTSGCGSSPFLFTANYKVIVPCFLKIEDKSYDLSGKVFEGNESTYSKKIMSKFDYIDSAGSQTWDIQMTIPIRLRVFAKDRLCIRIIFLKPNKELVKKSGNTGSCYRAGLILNILNIKLLTESNSEIIYDLQNRDEFLKFIANSE